MIPPSATPSILTSGAYVGWNSVTHDTMLAPPEYPYMVVTGSGPRPVMFPVARTARKPSSVE
jgi:hypothetical protein